MPRGVSPHPLWALLLCLVPSMILTGCDATTLGPASPHNTENPGPPDYTITVAGSTPGLLDDLGTAVLKVQVQNVGSVDTTGTFVTMYVDGKFLTDTVVEGLETLGTDTFTFNWPAEA